MAELHDNRLFSALDSAELQLLRQQSVERELPAHTEIFKEGDPGDGIYVIRSGQVEISALIEQKERRVLGRLGPGDFFGEMAVLDSEPRSATATTNQPTSLYFIPRQSMLALLETSPRLAVRLVREFSLRMRDFNRRYIQESLQAERLTLVGRFARSIVHDFKNPLNVIGLAADLMTMDKATPELRKSATTRIRRQVDRLSNMISELLEFTRGSQQVVVPERLNYRDYIRHLIIELEPEAHDKRVTLVLRRDPVHLFGDVVPASAISLSLAGDGAIELTTAVKKPGPDLDLAQGTAKLDLDDVHPGEPLPAYASLLHDVLEGDRTLFTTPLGLEAAWTAFEPLLGDRRPAVQPYAPGTWGPKAADALAGPHGWVLGRDA